MVRRNMIKRCIVAINFRLQHYLKNKFYLETLESKGKLFLFIFFIYLFIYLLVREIRIYIAYFFIYIGYFLKKPNNPIAKLVLFGQGRTGCSLSADLLSSYPQFQYDDEILHLSVFFPKLIIKAKCALSKKDIYGIKIKIRQLTDTQSIRDPKQFMHELYKQGWKIIYVKRGNILHQEVDALILRFRIQHYLRQEADQFIQRFRLQWKRKLKDAPSKLDKAYIDTKFLIERMNKRGMYLAQEEEILKNLPHITIVFENDLLRAENHQRTLDKILDYLGLPSVPVKTIFVRAASKRLSDSVQNYEEVVRAISQTKYAKFLEN